MRLNRFLSRFFLILGFTIVMLAIKYQSQLKEIAGFNLGKSKTHLDNFFSPEVSRKRPLSLLQRETELKLYIGQPFIDFSAQEWEEFWSLIYGVYPKGEPEKPGMPKKMRQLTTDEIAFELMELYPQLFAYFQESYWRALFDIALGKK